MLFDVDLLLELVGLIFGHRHGVVHDFDDFANLRSTVLERLDLSLQACDLQLKFLDANDEPFVLRTQVSFFAPHLAKLVLQAELFDAQLLDYLAHPLDLSLQVGASVSKLAPERG